MVKIGRNQPCPCGSGKKYKKCCLYRSRSDFPSVPKPDELDVLMVKGNMLSEKKESTKACDVWLEFWDKLKIRFKPEFRNIKEAETVFDGTDFIYNWCQDLEMELTNAGINDSIYFQKRIAYCEEFCLLFPDSDELLMHNMKRAIAESHFAIGQSAEGVRCFKELIEQYPMNIWGYINWGDMYTWPMNKDIEPDYERAEQIYKMALGIDREEEIALLNRLDLIQQERTAKA